MIDIQHCNQFGMLHSCCAQLHELRCDEPEPAHVEVLNQLLCKERYADDRLCPCAATVALLENVLSCLASMSRK